MSPDPILSVVFFRTEFGREPVREWLRSLDRSDRKIIGEDIKLVQLSNMNKYTGSTLDDFLAEEGILEQVSARAHKRLLVLQLTDIMEESNLSKDGLAQRLQTTRSQVDRLLDPDNTSITLELLERLARAVGRELKIELA